MNGFMVDLVRKKDSGVISVLAHVGFYVTFAYGIGYTFFGQTDSVQYSPLFRQGNLIFHQTAVSVWGLCAVIVTVFNTVAVALNKIHLGAYAAMGGFLIWLFASFVYLEAGLWFQFLVHSAPNLVFWTWYYLYVKGLERTRRV